MILKGVRGRAICEGPDLDRVIDGVAIGAMEPRHMLERVGPGTLVIVPGDREDVILTLAAAHVVHGAASPADVGAPREPRGRDARGHHRRRSRGRGRWASS